MEACIGKASERRDKWAETCMTGKGSHVTLGEQVLQPGGAAGLNPQDRN